MPKKVYQCSCHQTHTNRWGILPKYGNRIKVKSCCFRSISLGAGKGLYALNLAEDNSTVLDQYGPNKQRGICAKIDFRDERPDFCKNSKWPPK